MGAQAIAVAPHDPKALRDRYLAAQLAGNRRDALRVVVEGLESGLAPLECHEIVRDAQREIGRLWQEDRITIAAEHMATAISQLVLAHVYQHAEVPATNGKKVIVACVEGELHDFPARLVADALDLAGFEVRYLGASVPHHHLVRTLRDEAPDLVVLSVTMSLNVPALREAVALVARELPALPIAVGGAACVFSPSLVDSLGVAFTAADAAGLVDAARARLGVGR